MRKTMTYTFIALSIILVLTATTGPALAADYTKVGVKVGETASYRSAYSSPTTVNRSDFYVYGVAGSVASVFWTDYAKNGTVEYHISYNINMSKAAWAAAPVS